MRRTAASRHPAMGARVQVWDDERSNLSACPTACASRSIRCRGLAPLRLASGSASARAGSARSTTASRTCSSTWPLRARARAMRASSPRRSRMSAPSSNAATGYERTAYYARVLAEHAPFALDLIADILFAPHWAPDDLEKEKGVVAQERGEAFDAPTTACSNCTKARSIPTKPLGRPDARASGDAGECQRRDADAFREAHMTSERVVISIAGAFDRAAFLDAAEKRFGASRAPAPAQTSAPDAVAQAGARQRSAQAGADPSRAFMAGARLPARDEILRGALADRDFRRRHVFASVPGSARDARPRLRASTPSWTLRGRWPARRLCWLRRQECARPSPRSCASNWRLIG